MQQQDLLRNSVPDSPAGPPPTGPLPPIPRSLLHNHVEDVSLNSVKDGTPWEGKITRSAGVVNASHPLHPVPSVNDAQGGNSEGPSNPSDIGPSSFSHDLGDNFIPSFFAQQQEAHISHVSGSSKKATNASSVSLPSEKRNPRVIAEESELEQDNEHLTPLEDTSSRRRAVTSGSWNGKLHSESRGEHVNYASAGSLHLQGSSHPSGLSISNNSLAPGTDGGTPAAKSKISPRLVSDTKTKSNLSQVVNAPRDSLDEFSSLPNTSSKARATDPPLSSSSESDDDDVEGDGVLVQKSDLEGVLSTNGGLMDTSISHARQHAPSSYQMRTQTTLSRPRTATADATDLLSQSMSRRGSWLNGLSSAVAYDANTSSGVGGGATALFAGGDKSDASDVAPANLPDWSEVERGGPTSLPIQHTWRNLDFSLRRLLTVQVFEECE